MDSGDVVAFLQYLLREVLGRMILIWNGSPIHRSHTIEESWPTARCCGCTWSACRRIPRS
jgi:hypothetical protein